MRGAEVLRLHLLSTESGSNSGAGNSRGVTFLISCLDVRGSACPHTVPWELGPWPHLMARGERRAAGKKPPVASRAKAVLLRVNPTTYPEFYVR
jgi:hypothetical protein